jgi:hypothetical protein
VWPFIARPWAQARPAGPAPTTATLRPVAGARVKKVLAGRVIAASTAWRCRRPMAMGWPCWVLRTQTASHSSSVGQTRAHRPPSGLAARMARAAPRRSPSPMRRMNCGTGMWVGQACSQGASWQ